MSAPRRARLLAVGTAAAALLGGLGLAGCTPPGQDVKAFASAPATSAPATRATSASTPATAGTATASRESSEAASAQAPSTRATQPAATQPPVATQPTKAAPATTKAAPPATQAAPVTTKAAPVTQAPPPVAQQEVAAAGAAQRYPNCDALVAVYPHGVARTGGFDNKGKTGFVVDDALYSLNTHLDRDDDGVACER